MSDELMARLRDSGERRSGLIDELERSMAVQSLWPEVFDAGGVTIAVQLKPVGRDVNRPRVMRYQVSMVVKNKSGEERRFNFEDLPTILQDACIAQHERSRA